MKPLELRTSGLGPVLSKELVISVTDPSLAEEGRRFLDFASARLSRDAAVRAGEPLYYGYWATRMTEESDSWVAWERTPDGKQWQRGLLLTLGFWREQNETCAGLTSPEFVPPTSNHLAAVSAGVFEGDPVEGVRYPSSNPNSSGWYLTTDRYDGNVKSLRIEHLYHVTHLRPDLAKYLALPFGGRFYVSPAEQHFWHDPKVASQS